MEAITLSLTRRRRESPDMAAAFLAPASKALFFLMAASTVLRASTTALPASTTF